MSARRILPLGKSTRRDLLLAGAGTGAVVRAARATLQAELRGLLLPQEDPAHV